MGGHYDVHFQGFQDDNCAVGLVLAMANAMVKSGYQPENDIVFCLHGAEEWGSFLHPVRLDCGCLGDDQPRPSRMGGQDPGLPQL